MAQHMVSQPAQEQATPARRLVAAGIKRGTGPLLVEQPQQSVADKAAHAAYVRRPAMTS